MGEILPFPNRPPPPCVAPYGEPPGATRPYAYCPPSAEPFDPRQSGEDAAGMIVTLVLLAAIFGPMFWSLI